jgi:hypothetical protein
MPSSASSTFTVTLLRFHRRRWRVFVAFPEGRAIWAPGRNVKAGKDQQLVDDLDRPGNGARTLGSHQIPGIRR